MIFPSISQTHQGSHHLRSVSALFLVEEAQNRRTRYGDGVTPDQFEIWRKKLTRFFTMICRAMSCYVSSNGVLRLLVKCRILLQIV